MHTRSLPAKAGNDGYAGTLAVIRKKMKNIIVKILIVISIISCKEKPNYNPFDEQFNVSVNRLFQDNCDTIPVECGYYNLTKNHGKLRPYYQVYINDFSKVVGKGFIYEMDTFRVKGFQDRYTNKSQIDSILNLPINESELNQEFGKFGYEIFSRNLDTIKIVNSDKNDTIDFNLDTYSIYGNRYLVRGIGYFITENK